MSVAGVSVNDGESCENIGVGDGLVVLDTMREVAGDLIEALSTAVVCKAKVDCKHVNHMCAGETLPILDCKCTVAAA